MDYRVWSTMLGTCILCLALFGYRQISYHAPGSEKCSDEVIVVNSKKIELVTSCYLNQYSEFEILADSAARVEWNFGDGKGVEMGRVVSHKFDDEDTYIVTVSVNGYCEQDMEVRVVENPFHTPNSGRTVVKVIADPITPRVGEKVKFYCVTDLPSVNSYQWKVLNTNEIQTGEFPTFIFTQEGAYTVQLVLNNDAQTLTNSVIVATAGAGPTPPVIPPDGSGGGAPSPIGTLGPLVPKGANTAGEKVILQPNTGAGTNMGVLPTTDTAKGDSNKTPKIDESAFKELLQQVINDKEKELEDLYVYLDYKGSTKVEVNGQETAISIKKFCENMRGKKKNLRKIESLEFKVDDNQSIQRIQVKVPEGLWERLNPFK